MVRTEELDAECKAGTYECSQRACEEATSLSTSPNGVSVNTQRSVTYSTGRPLAAAAAKVFSLTSFTNLGSPLEVSVPRKTTCRKRV